MELTPWKCWWFGKHLNDNFDFRSQKGQIVEDTVVVFFFFLPLGILSPFCWYLYPKSPWATHSLSYSLKTALHSELHPEMSSGTLAYIS